MNEEQFFSEKPQANILVQIVHRYLPFWPIFVLFSAISLSIAYIYLRSQTKIYVAAAKVLLKDPQRGGGDSKVLDALNIFSEKKIVENEIIVLRSTSLMQEVVKQLDLYATVYNQGNVQVEELYKQNAPLAFVALDKDSVNSGGKHFFSIDWDERVVEIMKKKVPFDGILDVNGTPYRLAINPEYNRQAVGKNFFVVFNTVNSTASSIIASLRVAPMSYASTALELKIETPVPAKAKEVLNVLCDIYNKEGIEDKNQIAFNTLRFIEDRLMAVEGQVDSVDRNILNYRAREGITDLGSQAQAYFNSVRELDKRKGELDIQLGVLNDIQRYITSKAGKPGTVPSLQLVQDQVLLGLINQLYAAEFELDQARAVAGAQSETVLLAEEKVRRIKADVLESTNNIRNNYLAERKYLNSSIAQSSGMLRQIPMKELGLLNISRDREIKNNIYNYLLQKKEETALSSASTSADLRVLEKGYSYGPIRPIPKNYYLMGFLLGLLAFLLFVQVREQFNNKVMFRTEVENKTNVPVVAEIIQTPNRDNIAITEGKRTVVAEQFRALRTNLGFLGLSEVDNTILVTSSVSGEGKSFIATNLALSLTLTGKRVALMEMDLRKPKISKQLGVDRSPGISSYLVNKATVE
ncbi:MAG: hypothetical protein EOP49_01410, partial [Sphingobacteriales bacterium]